MRYRSSLLTAGLGIFLLLAQWGCGGGSCGCTPEPPKGSISGRLTDAGGAPLAGAKVGVAAIPTIHQDGVNEPLIPAGDATTDSNGRYQAEVHQGTYYVYSQPQVGSMSYAVQASAPVKLTDVGIPIKGVDLQFSPAATGQIEGTITPTATGTRRYFAYLGQNLTLDGVACTLSLRGTEALMSSGSNQFHFALLPEGEYTLNFSWSETAGNSGTGASTIKPVVVSIKAGETRTIQFPFP